MKLIPYINFGGNAREALDFYKNALNGNIQQLGISWMFNCEKKK
jgi:uncharacterized glyoxalase superfamily protein PhnB